MKRLLGLTDDPQSGGSTLDVLAAIAGTGPAIPVPDFFVPVTTAQVDPGESDLDRSAEVRGVRGNSSPASFASAPGMTFEALAYPALLRKILRKAFSGAISSTGTTPASIASTLGPLGEGSLLPLVGWLLREGQLDRLAGLIISEFDLNFPIDGEGTISVTGQGLFHKVDDSTAAMDPNGHAAAALPTPDFTGMDDGVPTFMLQSGAAYIGSGLVELPNLAGFGLTFNNGMITDFRTRFRPNHNILRVVDSDTVTHKVWYPNRHKLGAQTVTGRIDFSDVQPDQELKRIIRQAEKLVFEIAAGPLGTTPPADEMLRLTVYKKVLTGGGADPIAREGDQTSSYEFAGYIDPSNSNKDVEATFVGATALT